MRRRSRGFTLVEMMVSVALAGMVVAGALELHLTFNRSAVRQQQLADMQQTLRLSMLILERSLRAAGAGMTGGALTATGCGATQFYGFEFSEDNTLANITGGARTVFKAVGANDPDPDWFRTVAAVGGALPVDAKSDAAGVLTVNDPNNQIVGWLPGDFFSVYDPTTGIDCTRQVSGAPSGGAIPHDSAYSCFNNPGGTDCMSTLSLGAPVRHFSGTYTMYRVDDAGPTPRLMVSYNVPLGSATAPTWNVVAENIEDMQIAMILSDGTTCGSFANGTDTPPVGGGTCDPAKVEAVRLTLVARSAMTVSGAPPGATGGYEDRPSVVVNDGYLRRAMTSQIDLRNLTGQ